MACWGVAEPRELGIYRLLVKGACGQEVRWWETRVCGRGYGATGLSKVNAATGASRSSPATPTIRENITNTTCASTLIV